MKVEGWKYYNHAAIPALPPHNEANTSAIDDRSVFKVGKGCLMARWTSAYDCGFETQWWYVIKDTPFDISNLKSKRRYEVNKGLKNFEVKIVDPTLHKEELAEVTCLSFTEYPESYRLTTTVEEQRERWEVARNDEVVFAAFDRKTNELSGYAVMVRLPGCVKFDVQKTVPSKERLGVNAALVAAMLEHYAPELESGDIYIFDGERNINHETAFQDYLEKYFQFRKAYCKLHLRYTSLVGIAVAMLYPFRNALNRFSSIRLIHPICAVLRMENIRRSFSR